MVGVTRRGPVTPVVRPSRHSIMRDQTHLVNIACYGILFGGGIPLLQKNEDHTNPWAAIAFLALLIPFAYSFIRLRWQLPVFLDDTFEHCAPFAFILGIVIPIVLITSRWMQLS